MMQRPVFQRVAHVLATVGLGVAILSAAPMAEAFRGDIVPPGTAAKRMPLGPLPTGDLVARLSLPRLAVDAPIYEGVSIEAVGHGAGHLPGTAIPGEEGGTNHCVIAVPRDSAAAAVVAARIGDVVTLRTPFGVRTYRVASTRVIAPDAIETGPTGSPRVTLVTPYPADALGPSPMRLAVVLERT